MNEHLNSIEKKARQKVALGSVIGTFGVAGAMYEVAEGSHVIAGLSAVLGIGGFALAMYQGVRLASVKFVRENHDHIQYDRTHENLND